MTGKHNSTTATAHDETRRAEKAKEGEQEENSEAFHGEKGRIPRAGLTPCRKLGRATIDADGGVRHQTFANGRQTPTAPGGDPDLSEEDGVFDTESTRVSDLRANHNQAVTGEYVASKRPAFSFVLGNSGSSSSGNDQPRLPPNKRRRHRRRTNNHGTERAQASAQKLTELNDSATVSIEQVRTMSSAYVFRAVLGFRG
ncbi:hypothetical protein SARC_06281 [Sphaeroforma arctica JP610]|uniref:Uncharacterized protein n=1 Tax=Sphaeroforma arctica JP610 TaxID=667725 RepID=A0A0L0FXL7_9EUKA|nr:hypothetical protein SARC_06281 [Sphaeroforma arctica JP610]KNC81394.1 hypothetical protein SARC_06281 [Sphaeroforma arctica JP610]|eukprot:XP_014155296.1 hypothetical protein SARC_06281 [Sphaeroforma arctica JP610]